MSVELDPVELGFKRPFQQEVSQTLRLKNPHSDPVAFKVKTTAPKQYCVRPNSGRIEPGRDVEVQILLQAMKEDPAPDAKCRDKFLVQSVLVTADKEFTNVGSLWAHIEQTAKSSIQEKKIRVLFLAADADASSTPARTNGVSRDSMLSSPQSEAAVTPVRGATEHAQGPVSRVEDRPAGSKNLGQIEQETYNPASSGYSTATGTGASIQQTVAAAAASVTNAIPTSQAELQAQLDAAKAQIARLTQQADAGLRQRKPESARDAKDQLATATQQQTAPAGGVSVQITALLCLVSFLIAYFLF
ncbi:phosphatidylinositol-binding protein scs2 [Ascochyta rabiei]|uniref:Structural molecule n=1 Tax=Didymella rabiei TaxID=5454 RepID=A0A162YIG0_DIDRA|nr:phosphatidylinositol-binding protein scs2 [Ascochyta rabiei]KZM20064.1 structural molecule [Ascochyta rabiei]UPX17117.1 phosphatidylinositol-binding protein scs2 [Ascochyta rabiei]